VIFPGPEVADVARAAEAGGPGLVGLHYGVIQADKEEDQLFLLALFLQRRFNVIFSVSDGQRAQPDPRVFDDRDASAFEVYRKVGEICQQ
jgi:hypothetical protein